MTQKEAIAKRFKDRQQERIMRKLNRERNDRNEKYRLEHSKDMHPNHPDSEA